MRMIATSAAGAARCCVTRFDRFYEPMLVVLLAAIVLYGTL